LEKSFSSITIKALNEEKRELEGIASTPSVDRVGDIVEPLGLTFQKDAPLLLNHDHELPVGTVTFGEPTPRGLPFTAKIAKVNTPGVVKERTDTAWDSVKSGIIKSVSIGFRPRASKALSNGGTHFTAADVHELSLVSVPANPEATITAFKSAQTNKEFMKNINLAAQIRKAFSMTDTEAFIASTIEKSTVAPATAASSNLVYATQAAGVTPLVPVVTRSLLSMLAALGAPSLPPEVRALTQAALLAASEIAEYAPYPAAAPGTDFVLNGSRKFGLIVSFNDTLLAVGGDEVVSFVQTNLENAANNAVDLAMVTSLTAAAGTAQTSIKAAFAAFQGDLRTAAWIGNPETRGGLRSAQETGVGPNGGTFYQLPALPVLAMPNGTLMLVDAKRTAVYDGPMTVERSNEASIILDTAPGSAPANASQPLSLFQEHMTALKLTKFADYNLLVSPVAVSV
jgi:HK97 family phage prohead protease